MHFFATCAIPFGRGLIQLGLRISISESQSKNTGNTYQKCLVNCPACRMLCKRVGWSSLSISAEISFVKVDKKAINLIGNFLVCPSTPSPNWIHRSILGAYAQVKVHVRDTFLHRWTLSWWLEFYISGPEFIIRFLQQCNWHQNRQSASRSIVSHI